MIKRSGITSAKDEAGEQTNTKKIFDVITKYLRFENSHPYQLTKLRSTFAGS